MVTKDEAIKAAGMVLARARQQQLAMTPREQAEAAWTPSSRFTVDELEQRIRARRGLAATQAKQSA